MATAATVATVATEAWTQPGTAGVHTAAQRGFSLEAGSYARGRPGCPAGLVRWLEEELCLHSNAAVVDLGAGTGKFTQLLLGTGAEVVAVEPVAAMREKLTHPALRGQDMIAFPYRTEAYCCRALP